MRLMRRLERVVVRLGQIRARPPIGQDQSLIQMPAMDVAEFIASWEKNRAARAHPLLSRR